MKIIKFESSQFDELQFQRANFGKEDAPVRPPLPPGGRRCPQFFPAALARELRTLRDVVNGLWWQHLRRYGFYGVDRKERGEWSRIFARGGGKFPPGGKLIRVIVIFRAGALT